MIRITAILLLLLAPLQADIAAAKEIGERLRKKAQRTDTGWTFAKGPGVYAGDAGVAIYFAALYRATKDKRWLEATRETLRHAVDEMPTACGLYVGRAGVGEACLECFWATGDKRFLRDARRCAERLPEYAATDIISGAAGTGIFLLNLHRATGDKKHLAAAQRAGDYLLAHAVRKGGQASWPIAPGKNKAVYLGFSHGAAGIGYFLLHLGRRTGVKRYTVRAHEAAQFLLEHEEDGHWWRTVPATSTLRRVQWCHGAPGIGLFFKELPEYADAYKRCLTVTEKEGRTARESGCQCHGVAGNAELFLEEYVARKDKRWFEEARKSGRVLLKSHMKIDYDPSYMTGLAGMGHFFLRLADPAGTPLPLMIRTEKPK